MSYRIRILPRARAEIRALPGAVRAQALELAAALAHEPRPPRAQELSRPGLFRIWLASRWRIAYLVDSAAQTVFVLRLWRHQRIDFETITWVNENIAAYDEAPREAALGAGQTVHHEGPPAADRPRDLLDFARCRPLP